MYAVANIRWWLDLQLTCKFRLDDGRLTVNFVVPDTTLSTLVRTESPDPVVGVYNSSVINSTCYLLIKNVCILLIINYLCHLTPGDFNTVIILLFHHPLSFILSHTKFADFLQAMQIVGS